MKIKSLSPLKRHNRQVLFGVSEQQDNECSTSKLHLKKTIGNVFKRLLKSKKIYSALQNIGIQKGLIYLFNMCRALKKKVKEHSSLSTLVARQIK